MDVLDLKAKISLDKSEYDAGLDDASEKTKGVGSKIGGALKTAGKVGGVAIAAVGAAVTATTTALVKGVSDVAAYGDNIDKMSQKMGLTAEAYQEWDAVMQHSGTSMESMQASMKTLANAVETGNEAFEKIGLTQEELADMSQQDIFEATIAGLQNIEDTTERTYLAGKLLGRGATELGALLNTSAEETQAMRDRVHELGGVMSDEAVKSAAAFQDQLQDLTTGFEGVKRGLISELLPSVTEVMSGLTNIFAGDYDAGLEQVSSGIENAVNKISDILPRVIEIGGEIVGKLAVALVENVPKIVPSVLNLIGSIGQTLIENLGMIIDVGLQIVMQIVQGITEALPTLIPTIVTLVTDIAQTLIENVPLLIDAAVQLISGLVDGIIQALPILIEKIPTLVQSVVEAVNTSLPILIDGVIQLVMGIVEALPSLIVSIVDIIPSLINSVIEAVVTALPILIEGVTQLVIGLVDALPEIIIALVDAIPMIVESFVNGLIEALPMLIEGVTQLVIALVAALPEITMALIEAIPEIITGILNAAIPLTEGLLGVFSDAWTKSQAAFDGVGDFFVETFNGAKEAVSETWSDFAENFVTSWEGVKNAFVDVVPYFSQRFSEAVAIISEVWNTLQEFFAFSWESQKMVFADVGNYFGEKFRAGASNIKSAFSEITSFFTDLWARIRNIFADAPQKFAEIGKNIVAGIKNGISNAWANFKDWVLKMFGDLLGSIKGLLGIGSPSKVFANEVGKWIPAGVAVGIEDNMGTLDKAIEGMYREIPLDFSATSAANVATVSDASNTTADGGGMAEILSLLREIRDGGNVTVVLEGDADRLFRVIQSKATSNYRLTGNAGLLTI